MNARKKYSTYDKDFYAIIHHLFMLWIIGVIIPYLLPNEFLLHSNHESLKCLNSRHAKRVESSGKYIK